MFIAYYILCAIVGLLFGFVLAKSREPKCNHKWKLIEDFKINNVYSDGRKHQVGIMKVYECEHCKKMKQIKSEL